MKCEMLHIYFVAVMTSVVETKLVSTSPVHGHSCQASAGLSMASVTSNASVVSAAVISDVSMQDHSSCTGPSASSSVDKCRTDPMGHMHYGSAPVHQYRPVILQPPRVTSHPNAAYYHPSTDFHARMSPSYRQMVTFAAGQIPCAAPGYAAYDRHVAGSSWSVSMPRHCEGVYGLTAQPVSSAADVTPPVSDTQEPVRAAASTKSKKKSRAQQRESYSSILERSVPCPNIDVRQIIQEQRERIQMEAASCSALGIRSSAAPWTMPTAGLHAFSSQQMSSQSSTASSTTVISSVGDGRSSSPAVSQCGSMSIAVTTDVSSSSTAVTLADSILQFLPATTLSSVSRAFGCSSSLSYATTSSVGTNVSCSHVMAGPVLTSVSCAASWVRHPQFGQHMRWSQYSGHPMSCTTVTRSSVGMSPFNCSRGQQVLGVPPYPALEPRLNDVLAPAAVTMTTGVVDSSGWLPGGPSSATGTVKGESPIRLVQNMVSGLETTQNSLAMATSLIISQSDSVPRRRRSGAADAAVTATNTASIESPCDDVRFNSESLDIGGQTDISVPLPDEVRHPQARLNLPCTSAVTTVTSVWTQVVPATSVVPSACCAQVTHPSVSCDSDAVGLSTDTVCLTATSPTSNTESTTVSGGDVVMDSTCQSESTASAVVQPLNDSRVIDDDDSTQDCDISADLGEVLCTTGTQTSTPASVVSNCNSVESGGDGSESSDVGGPIVCAADDVEPRPDTVACSLPASRPSAVCEEKPPDGVHSEQIPVPSSAAVVLIPRVPQASFFLPQNIAFAPNPLASHGFLQFQPPGEFGYGTGVHSSSGNAVGQPGTLGLVHFATGPMVGPAVGNMMAASDASGSFRLMTPVKSDSDAYSGAEFLPLMPAAMPTGHILLQNIVPTGLASTIVPIMQPAALCNLPGGSPALFAVSQGSVMSVGAPLAFASVPVPGQHHSAGDHAQDQPDSTVDNSEMDMTDELTSDDSADTEQVTSTDEPFDEVSNNPAADCAMSTASMLHCTTSLGTDLSLTKTNPCSDHECSNNTSSSRTEYNSLHSDQTAGGSSVRHSTAVQRSWSTLKKRAHLGRSRLKKMRRDHGFAASAVVNQTSVVSASTRDRDVRSLDAMMSPLRSEEFIDSPCFNLETKDAVTSDSSVSTTISLHDGTTGSTNVSTVDRSRRHAGSAQKARWKKQALARQTRLPLRHSKPVVKQLVDARLSPSDTSVVGG